VTDLSIGFNVTEHFFMHEDSELVRHVQQADLWEISLVTWGANPGAKVSEVNAIRDAERALHRTDRLPDLSNAVRLSGGLVWGAVRRSRDGVVELFLRADMSPKEAMETCSHELMHLRQFCGLSGREFDEQRAVMEEQAGAFGQETARQLKHQREPLESDATANVLAREQKKAERARLVLGGSTARERYRALNPGLKSGR
jgi:hypothetical protein